LLGHGGEAAFALCERVTRADNGFVALLLLLSVLFCFRCCEVFLLAECEDLAAGCECFAGCVVARVAWRVATIFSDAILWAIFRVCEMPGLGVSEASCVFEGRKW
jgi:hypothetical protein